MSKIVNMAVAIDEEFDQLRNEIKSYTLQLEEYMIYQEAKNHIIADMLRELADRIEREEI